MRTRGIFIIIAAVLVGGILLYFLSGGQNSKKFVWEPTLNQDEKQPYDFSILQELLSKTYNWERLERGTNGAKLDSVNAEGSAYIFVGLNPFYNDISIESLFSFAKRGGDLIFIAESLPDSLLLLLSEITSTENLIWVNSINSKSIKSRYSNDVIQSKKFPFSFRSGDRDSAEYYWAFFPDYPISSKVSLGSFSLNDNDETDFTNFIGFKIGKGHFYWHCNPLVFTNLYLSKNNISGFEHLNAFLSHFDAERWYWDHTSTYSPRSSSVSNTNSKIKPKTPLEYIFSQPALTFSWLILVSMTILYALFAAKRRQQQIELIEPNRNNSLEFVNTIGRLYYQQQNHKVIFEKIMQLFRSHLRRRYGLFISDDDLENPEVILASIKRTDVNEQIIRDIFSTYLELKSKVSQNHTEMSAETLKRFYQLVNKFYEAEFERKNIKSTSKIKI